MSSPVLSRFAVHHFSISVADLETAIAWYGDVFGFEVERRMNVPGIPAVGAFVKRGDYRIELWQTVPGSKVPEERKIPDSDLHSGGTKHVGFAVPDLQSYIPRLLERGIDIAAVQRVRGNPMRPDPDPADPSKPPAHAVFIRDPFGTLIELLDAANQGVTVS